MKNNEQAMRISQRNTNIRLTKCSPAQNAMNITRAAEVRGYFETKHKTDLRYKDRPKTAPTGAVDQVRMRIPFAHPPSCLLPRQAKSHTTRFCTLGIFLDE
jgi:hypothetical protein